MVNSWYEADFEWINSKILSVQRFGQVYVFCGEAKTLIVK